jgi:hypothetical protein
MQNAVNRGTATQQKKQQSKKKYTQGVITPQAWIKETETGLSNSEELTLPGGFEPTTPKSLA